jgi:TolA-binding protein
MDRKREAAREYERIATELASDPPAAAQAMFRAGELYLELGDDGRAYTLLWKTVTDHPVEAFAADALRVVLRDGRRRDPAELYRVLAGLVGPMAETEVADNLLFALADLAENEFGDTTTARELYDRLAEHYPDSGLRDESLWHGARLSRRGGDGRGAAERLRRLLATREVAFGAGSYFSVWLDNAQLELGRVLRDDLRDYDGALAAFRQLPRHYPASVLKDDALFEGATTLRAMGKPDRACAELIALGKRYPDSKYELERAPALRRELHCE